jgi:aryl-alcohol dehydrogenase-like predicted oxidoreductase
VQRIDPQSGSVAGSIIGHNDGLLFDREETKMNYSELRNTDIKISEMVLGCWALGGGYTWGEQEEADSIATVHAAIDLGINCFDTAEFYGGGRSEEVLGKALQGKRQSAVVATKVWVDNMSREGVVRACEGSLKRLRTEYLDLYLIHWPNRDVPMEETLEAMLSLESSGKVRSVGVCNFGVKDLEEASTVTAPAVNQLPYNLLFRAVEYEILEACRRHHVPVLAYSALAQGLLTGKFKSPADVDDERARIRFYSKERPGTVHDEEGYEEQVFGALSRVRSICQSAGVSMAHTAILWLLQRPEVMAVLVGARNPGQIRANVEALDFKLPERAVRELEEATEELKAAMGPNPDMWRTKSRFR